MFAALTTNAPITAGVRPHKNMSESGIGTTFISRWIERTEKSVGVITLLLSIAIFAAGSLLGGPVVGALVALLAFGVFGALEVAHVKANAELQRRATHVKEQGLFWPISQKYPSWKPKIIKELKHGGIHFNAIGFEKMPVAFEISAPLCLACKGRLTERIGVKFPARTRIEFVCECGLVTVSAFTEAELVREVSKLAALPCD